MPSPFPAGDVSPQAATMIALLPSVPLATLQAVERGLAANLAAPTSAELREARLGLLMFVLRHQTGELPLADSYNQLRAERAALGEDWPHSTTLLRAYGTWHTAVLAAMRLLWDGSDARVAYTHVGKGHDAPYERWEIHAAIERFHREHGRWPTSRQFYEWGRQLKRLARQGGHPVPRVPSSGALQKKYPDFAAALAAARREMPTSA